LVLLEGKCSTNQDTIRDGLFQLLGYAGDLKLHLEPSAKLGVVAFEAGRYAGWPKLFPVNGFMATVTDLNGFALSLEQLYPVAVPT
jgi:hypothetical protein